MLAQVNSARDPAAALQLQTKTLQSKPEVQAKNYVKIIDQIKIQAVFQLGKWEN